MDRTSSARGLGKRLGKRALLRMPYLGAVLRERDQLRAERDGAESAAEQRATNTRQFVPPGHFYSSIPCLDSVRQHEDRIFDRSQRILSGIDLNDAEQLELLLSFKKFYDELPFQAQKTPAFRYFFENHSYEYSDAIFLYCMIRHTRPKRIIEVGSGYSSCVTLDTNERFFNYAITCTFIDPSSDLLLSLMRPGDSDRVEIVTRNVQDVGIDRFCELASGDILFVDSTHVSKVGSDVNYLFFEILPRLAPGVLIHFHDIFCPFEYPKERIYEGRAWTEAYLLRSFLEFNETFKIVLFNTYLEQFHQDFFFREMPLCLRNPGGSIWLRRVK